jgi:hypothetical protein
VNSDLHPSNKELVAQTARRVAHALENPRTWCQEALARDKSGLPVEPLNPAATCWCVLGHAYRVGGAPVATKLSIAYLSHFDADVTEDNDIEGREYVRERLLQLAQCLEGEEHP